MIRKTQVGGDTDKAGLCQRTRGPMLWVRFIKPCLYLGVGNVQFMNERNEDIDIEQKAAHSSWSSSILTCSVVIRFPDLGKSKTGQPFTYFMRDRGRVAR